MLKLQSTRFLGFLDAVERLTCLDEEVVGGYEGMEVRTDAGGKGP